MEDKGSNDPFLQLKIDYISFMVQMFKMMAYDEATMSIQFALLMENTYLTQEQLEVLTGYSRSTISEVLSKLANSIGDFPIYQTRKAGAKTKQLVYYCPNTFEQYIKTNFIAALRASEASIEFIPMLIARLDVLTPQDPSVQHVKSFLTFFLAAMHYYRSFIEVSGDLLDNCFSDPGFVPDFTDLLKEASNTIPAAENPPKVKYDSLMKIKRELIDKMMELSADLIGGKEEMIKIFIALFLESEPVTQDDLMELCICSRGKVSQALSTMIELRVVRITKKTGDRKKYYEMVSGIEGYGTGKLARVTQYYTQIEKMLESKFLTDLQKIEVQSENDRKEKERLDLFFKENIRSFQIFQKLSKKLHGEIQKEMNTLIPPL